LLHSISHQSTVKKKIQVKYFIGSEICTPAIFETEKGHGKDTKKLSSIKWPIRVHSKEPMAKSAGDIKKSYWAQKITGSLKKQTPGP